DGAVQIGVFPAGEFQVEPGPDLGQGSHGSPDGDRALGRPIDVADHLEERAFSSAVMAHQSQPVAPLQSEIDILETPEKPPLPLLTPPSGQAVHQRLLDPYRYPM